MPFAVKDVLHYKRNDRQKREIHEKEYLNYLSNLRQQQVNLQLTNQYYLSSTHIHEIERSHVRHELIKQNQYAKIQQENQLLYKRLVKAHQRSFIDHRNDDYQQNSDTFYNKRVQQRSNNYKRIENNNHIILERLSNVRAHLITKEQCENDWKKHLNVMKKTCNYPENLDKFVSKASKTQQKQTCLYAAKRSAQWDSRHNIIGPSIQLRTKSLGILLDNF